MVPGRVVAVAALMVAGAVLPAAAAAPTWTFTVSAAVTRATADHYGGIDAVRRLAEAQIDTIDERFNQPEVFAGTFDFVLAELYVFEGPVGQELFRAHPHHDYRVVFDGFPTAGGGWFGSHRAIHHSWSTALHGGTFGAVATDGLVHEFGHARGAIDVYALDVNAESNPVSGQAYRQADASIMNYPYGVRSWDRHSVNIINRNGGTVELPISYITRSFPSAFTVRVVDKNGGPVADAGIELYPVEWFSLTVSAQRIMQGTTSADGTWTMPSNPFGPDTPGRPWDIRYPILLVHVTAGAATGNSWLPLTDVQNSFFDGRATSFEVGVTAVGPPPPEAVVSGAAFYSDGSSTRAAPTGTRVSVFATSAEPGFGYQLVSGRTAAGSNSPCSTDVAPINAAVKFANAQGVIGQTAGVLDRPPGAWQVCYLARGQTVTGAATYTVTS